MAVFSGPKIANDGLTFYMDSSNTRRSWKGSPTTNLVGNNFFDGNGNFTIDENVSDVMPDGSIGVARLLNAQFVTDLNRTVSIGSYALDAGQTYTLSFYVMNIDCTGFSGNLYSPTLLRVIGSITYPTVPTDVWTRVITTFTVPNEGPNPVTVSPQAFRDGGNGRFKLCWLQLEQNTFATPYVNGTRSNTQVLIDISRNNNLITANGVIYYSNNTFSFDGTTSRFTTTNSTYSANSTWEAVINCEQSVNTFNMFMGQWPPYISFYNGDRLYFSNLISNIQRTVQTPANLSTNRWYHTAFVTTYDSTSNNSVMAIYTNGVQTATGTFSGVPNNHTNLTIGDGRTNSWYPFKGKVDLVKKYNRELSANEISDNFQAIRNRYGI
jgi:hypothetical protein